MEGKQKVEDNKEREGQKRQKEEENEKRETKGQRGTEIHGKQRKQEGEREDANI